MKDGGFYGWPYSYIGRHYDPKYVGALLVSDDSGNRIWRITASSAALGR